LKPHEQLAASDPVMARLVADHGELTIEARRRRRPAVDAYGMLLRSVVGQQLSVKAAATIYGRVLDLFGGSTPVPEELLQIEPERLRAAGLSGRKVEYVRDLAAHVMSGELELDRLGDLEDEQVIAEITAVRGFGVWSVRPRCPALAGRADRDRGAVAAASHACLHLPLGVAGERA
jgi:DNA-3-methyladenine glycosylase II